MNLCIPPGRPAPPHLPTTTSLTSSLLLREFCRKTCCCSSCFNLTSVHCPYCFWLPKRGESPICFAIPSGYDTLWASVIKPVPRLGKSESGQMVSKMVKLTHFYAYLYAYAYMHINMYILWQTMWNHTKNSRKGLKTATFGVFRHASVSSTYPCPSGSRLVTLSDFQYLVALSEKIKVKS